MTFDELTTELSEQNCRALLLCPMYIGGDSTDIITFVENVYSQPVTDSNFKQVAQEFRQWYKQVAPDEYHDPAPDPFWQHDERGRFAPGHSVNSKPEADKLVRTQMTLAQEHLDWLDEQTGNRSKALRKLIDKEMETTSTTP